MRSRSISYSLAGVMLAFGSPLGWLLLRVGSTRGVPSVVAELYEHATLYAYLWVGTTLAFATFGAALGRVADRLQRAVGELSTLALSDALTGVRNARYFHERLREECKRAVRTHRPLALISLDLDHFKKVNDTHGHPVGDEVLAHVGALLLREVRGSDVPCRVGGEEFAVLCPGATLEEASHLAARLRAALEAAPAVTAVGALALTASFGVAALGPKGDYRALVLAADEALYAAKREGRNRVVLAAS